MTISVAEVATRRDSLLAEVQRLVELESPSTEKAAVDRLVAYVRERARQLGAMLEEHPQADYGDLTVASWPACGAAPPEPLLVLTHLDTVWPVGTLARRPFRVEGDTAYGPGIYDMKASVAMFLEAVRLLHERGLAHRPLRWLINTEEEVGSPVSRPLIEAEAQRSALVLCLEPPAPGGALKTARKGVGIFTVRITGRAAHAGADPEQGVSAIQELANQIAYLHSLSDQSLGTTVNVGVVGGGTRSNVVAAEAWAKVDVRVATRAEAERVIAAVLGARPWLPGATVTVEGGLNRPPMERTPAIAAAFERARAIGRELGVELSEAATGGASDGNFTAALGVPTLDGLGCPGDGAHAEHERISLSGLIERTALLSALLHRL
ncbi:M20 family metallopeptidase [Thermomicrobium sp. 4228-Ro]|uniref:M20 family metallopeptidase n=1 Tax=Thermomicrobium sp. 4228-Ro TaxID=2993937 RepID=UPI0022489919|nr:M20 family metallopeptidase [Thermomicrobium sp. 4228-Ro]MCX2727056.1 M20 family metallopeptidase [Thermomicrobium sp. 4228-Ro]